MYVCDSALMYLERDLRRRYGGAGGSAFVKKKRPSSTAVVASGTSSKKSSSSRYRRSDGARLVGGVIDGTVPYTRDELGYLQQIYRYAALSPLRGMAN